MKTMPIFIEKFIVMSCRNLSECTSVSKNSHFLIAGIENGKSDGISNQMLFVFRIATIYPPLLTPPPKANFYSEFLEYNVPSG